jgi:hypothetical protein
LLGQGDDAPASEGWATLAGVGFMLAFPPPKHVWVDSKSVGGFVDALGFGEFDGFEFVLLVVKFSGHVSLHCGAELFVHKILPTSVCPTSSSSCLGSSSRVGLTVYDSVSALSIPSLICVFTLAALAPSSVAGSILYSPGASEMRPVLA